MKKVFKKNKFSFDITDTLLIACFEMFCEFYENGDISIVDWESDLEHREVKKSMDHLYFYWTVLRQKHKKSQDKLLDIFYGKENYKSSIDDNKDGYFTMESGKKLPDYKYDKLHKIENFIDNCEQKNLELLIRIRGYLWT